ncbi:heparan sulfate 2-O-sulfotransferase 1-like [Copidosoma floridanum]|uniref:heparan sulfate 2-O-sulfotransferase 1-like n=1 Tax=Copidosoma floridanum TaxID=29053 RepID=UPI0006C949FC|nr:heparan sulfate 2-O-sulfotransferase 1-like [Copidosoma floridanum]
MLLRTFSFQWVYLVLFAFIAIYVNIRLNYLEETNENLQNALQQLKAEIKNNPTPESKTQTHPLSKDDSYVVIYNRVPKTGSTSFVGVIYDLCKKNKYHALHINITNNMHTLMPANQMQFVRNISYWDSMKPAFYHGHIAFLNFQKFGFDNRPLYINILRKPLDRFVSYYYFLRYGDNFRPHLIRRKHGDTKTFDECINAGQADCDPNNMWLQIPFLCGHDPACWEVGNQWALEEAKRNLQRHYLIVGVTEELSDFILVLQSILPRFFKGAHNLFLHNNKSHLRQTTQKIEPLPETVKKIQKTVVWKMENELYNYALSQFHALKRRVINASVQDVNQRFFYEKIRPK